MEFADFLLDLRSGDNDAWEVLLQELIPTARIALRRRSTQKTCSFDEVRAEAIQSAVRTLFRRLSIGEFNFDRFDDLAGLFVIIAWRKLCEKTSRSSREIAATDLGRGADDSRDPIARLFPDAAQGPPDVLLQKEMAELIVETFDHLVASLQRLNRKYVEMLQLVLDSPKKPTIAQIARSVGCSRATVDRGLSCIRGYLREELAKRDIPVGAKAATS